MLGLVASRVFHAGDLLVRLANGDAVASSLPSLLSALLLNWIAARIASLVAVCAIAAFLPLSSSADSLSYTYDALGRLIEVDRSDGTQTIYTLDAAGNRTDVKEGAPPATPGSITVPSNSTTGSYSISWTASSTGTVSAYELYESTTSNFSSQTRIYQGTSTSRSITGKGNGTFYYRVRACWVSCTGYRTGSNGVTVTLPPSTPGTLSAPATNNTGSYSIGWGASSGALTAYELYQANSSNFSGQTRVYNSTGTSVALSGRGDGTYYYRARACNGGACSSYTAAKTVAVAVTPGVPGALSIPASSGTGNYVVSWGASSGNVTAYVLQEATNSGFTDAAQIYSGTTRSFSITGRGNGNYWYRVRACNGTGNCSGVRNGANPARVTLPPGAPSSMSLPSTSSSGSYDVGWGVASGVVTTYELWEATNSSFSGQTRIYNGTARSFAVGNKTNGTYYYRARACNDSYCGGYVSDSIVVLLKPSVPGVLSIPASSGTGNYTVSWGASTGTVTAYKLQEATNSGFTDAAQIYSGTANSFYITGRGNGNYWYRVFACNAVSCSGVRNGANYARVTLPPGVPSYMSLPPTSSSGSYTLRWGEASGVVTRYELWEATNPSYSGQTRIYNGTEAGESFPFPIGNKTNGTYYYRARACNVSYCGGYVSDSIVVSLPPASPPAPTGLSSWQSSMCSYNATWNASAGATGYILMDKSGEIEVTVTSPSASYSFCGVPGYSGTPADYKPKWVRACAGTVCSVKVNFP